MGSWEAGEVRRCGDGEARRRGGVEMRKWGGAEARKWGDQEVERWEGEDERRLREARRTDAKLVIKLTPDHEIGRNLSQKGLHIKAARRVLTGSWGSLAVNF